MRNATRRPNPDVAERLDALAVALDVADGRVFPDAVARGKAIVERAGERLRRSPELTVVALAGATGSGKSSLFNALAGTELARVSILRPTTDQPQAAIWGEADAGHLLDWLGVRVRRLAPARDEELVGLVLLDLPDHDSVVREHRQTVDRLVERADLLVWVVDPQKYADAALHERYLRPLASHREVMIVVLNHADRLERPELDACLDDLRSLLGHDRLGGVPVLPASARTGVGLRALRAALADRVTDRQAAVERLAADVDDVVAELAPACDDDDGDGDASLTRPPESLVDALAEAGGVTSVVEAVDRSHRRSAVGATGWPVTRWLRRFRPDPLARLHLGEGADPGSRTSLPPPTASSRARVDNAVRALAADVAGPLAPPWPTLVRQAALASSDRVADALDVAVASTVVGPERRPRWWAAAGALQTLLAVAALVGGVWLLVLFVLEWVRLPDPPLPRLGELPVPTILFLGGLALGFVLSAVNRRLAAVGGRRRARRVEAQLRLAVADVAEEHVVDPIRSELAARRTLCTELARARRPGLAG